MMRSLRSPRTAENLRRVGRVLAVAARVAAGIIVMGILFVVLEGNPDNALVSTITDAAEFLVGPFDDLFKPSSEKLGVAISWGIGAVVYLMLGKMAAKDRV